MAGKRQAGKELNHDNWNDEEESEEAGEFKKAASDVLNQRVRKIAKRRVAGGGGDDENKSINPFLGFGGFNSSTNSTSAANPSPFSFLAKLPATSSTTTTNPSTSSAPKTNGEIKKADDGKVDYLSKVKALNVSFLGWIKQHIDEDSLCDLTPVFRDYEKYMKEFEALKTKPVESEPKKDTPASTFSFGKPSTSISQPPPSNNSVPVFKSDPVKTSVPLTETKGFSFGLSTPANTQPFSFGLQKTSTAIGGSVPLFGAVSSTPFSFSNVTQNSDAKTDSTKATNEEEESEEPPKNEFTPVVEEDSLYQKRCKVFVKNDKDYAERGVGTLFLKKVDDKVQLLVRADTNLGNILLNIIVGEGLPVSRMGKNNVMIMCVPTPESKPPPVPVLVRVKTGDEADELLETINKHKK
jgi:nuclear pore complex protein Nup50